MKTATHLLTLFFILCVTDQSFAQLRWESYRGTVPKNAIEAGFENGKKMPACRVSHKGGTHPGKVVAGMCHIGYGGEELYMKDFEILVHDGDSEIKWVKPNRETLPDYAFLAGQEDRNHKLYVGLVDYTDPATGKNLGRHVGKVHQVNGDLMINFGYGGKEIEVKDNFLVLTELPVRKPLIADPPTVRNEKEDTKNTPNNNSATDTKVDPPTVRNEKEDTKNTPNNNPTIDTTVNPITPIVDPPLPNNEGFGMGWLLLLLPIIAIIIFLVLRNKKEKPATSNQIIDPTPAKYKSSQYKSADTIASKIDVDEIKILISENEMDVAMDKLLTLLKEKSTDVFNEIIMYNSQLKELERKSRIGAISFEQENLERNKIKSSMLSILDELAG